MSQSNDAHTTIAVLIARHSPADKDQTPFLNVDGDFDKGLAFMELVAGNC